MAPAPGAGSAGRGSSGGAQATASSGARISPSWSVAAAYLVVMLGTTLPTPLYPLYQRELGFSTLTSTVVFAAYAGGVLAALLLLGSASDLVGRRPVLVLGLVCAGVGDAVFLVAGSVATLLAARVLSGLSAGVFTGTATAALVDLDERPDRATVVATVANVAGLGLGPLLAGALAQLAPSPLRLPYAVHLLLLVLVARETWRLPETITPRGGRALVLVPPSVPHSMRALFLRAATAGFAGFAVLGLCTATAPLVMAELRGHVEPAFAGAVVCGMLAASAVGQVVLVERLEGHALTVGCCVLVVGAGALASALAAGSLALLLLAALVTGAGQGVSFRAALTLLNVAAPAERRGGVASAFFVVAYVAISLPVIGVGLAARAVGLREAGTGLSAAVAVLAAVVAVTAAFAPAGPVDRIS